MPAFAVAEKARQASLKQVSNYFSTSARQPGFYKGRLYDHVLPLNNAAENLYIGIREPALDFFKEAKIQWHQSKGNQPPHNLLSSQVCGVNFLFPFANQPDALRDLLYPLYPELDQMLPIEGNGFATFEYIGAQDYLREMRHKNQQRKRGANVTSADAAVMFRRTDGRKQIVLIEWKYCESYGANNRQIAVKSGTDRALIYQHLFDQPDTPINKTGLTHYHDLFYEPFYQFMRQQFLAHEMERTQELGAAAVTVLHISPLANTAFAKITSPHLRAFNGTATSVWQSMLTDPAKFAAVYTEDLFGNFPIERYPALADWWAYLQERYGWWL